MMKSLILLSILSLSTIAFGQSKKTINKELSHQLSQVEEINDSIREEFFWNRKDRNDLRNAIVSIDEALKWERVKIDLLREDIHTIKGEMSDSGDNPDEFVSENELNVIYSLVTQAVYQNEAQKITDTSQFVIVTLPGDISDKKIKVQNVLLQEKIDEYKRANSQNALIISQQKVISEKLNRLKTSAKDQLDVCVKMKQTLQNKYTLLSDKQKELDDKRYDEHVKMLEEEANKASKKKKSSSKIKFLPPVIVDEGPIENDLLMDVSYGNVESISSKEVAEQPELSKETRIAEVYVDEMPEFPGGSEALVKYLHDNLKYPQSAVDAEIQGKVYMKFVVSETGEISNITVVRGIVDCFACETEAVRVVSQMPKWKPGRNNGSPVSCYYTLPVAFKLDQ